MAIAIMPLNKLNLSHTVGFLTCLFLSIHFMPLKKTYAEASTSQLVVATDNPYRSLALTELTQEPQPQTPQVDLTKSGDEMSDTGAAASLL